MTTKTKHPMLKIQIGEDGNPEVYAQGTRTEHAFTGNASDKWDNAMENKDAVLFGNELSGAYLDGYLGVK